MRIFSILLCCFALSVGGCGPVNTPTDQKVVPEPKTFDDGPVSVVLDALPESEVYAEFAVFVDAGQYRDTDALVAAVNIAKRIGRLPKNSKFDAAFPTFASRSELLDTSSKRGAVSAKLRGIK